jgi:nucleoid-associated protein YgaU
MTSEPTTPEVLATPVVTAETDNAAPEFAPAPEAIPSESNMDLADRVGEVIQNNPKLEGIESFEVDDEHIILTGSVATSQHRKQTEALILAVPGIYTVDTESLTILARTVGTTHMVQDGDTLGGIAHRYYGDSALYQSIVDGNQEQLGDNHALAIGQELSIPAVD